MQSIRSRKASFDSFPPSAFPRQRTGAIKAFGVAALLSVSSAGFGAPICDPSAETIDPRALVQSAIDLTRGLSSTTEMTMTVTRPSWTRTSSLKAVTRGRDDALIHFTAPAKDAGNGTLKKGEQMWTYTPKLGRTIRLPYSLMSQSWAGSDFSYNDLSRTDDLLKYYQLSLADSRCEDGEWLYTVAALPEDDAPVVWGKEEMLLGGDAVIRRHTFFDQSLEPVKRLETLEVSELGGRTMGVHIRMGKLDSPEEFTELTYDAAEFDVDVADSMFTLFALKNGG